MLVLLPAETSVLGISSEIVVNDDFDFGGSRARGKRTPRKDDGRSYRWVLDTLRKRFFAYHAGATGEYYLHFEHWEGEMMIDRKEGRQGVER